MQERLSLLGISQSCQATCCDWGGATLTGEAAGSKYLHLAHMLLWSICCSAVTRQHRLRGQLSNIQVCYSLQRVLCQRPPCCRYDYICEGSAAASSCMLWGRAHELAARCDADPLCRIMIDLPFGWDYLGTC